MTLLVRNEEDILEPLLDYHLAQGVDAFVAMDNGSADRTPEILRAYEQRGVLEILPCEDSRRFLQSAYVTRMARHASAAHGADWVIDGDADEFFWPAFGSLKDVLAAVPERYGAIEVPRNDMLPPLPGAPSLLEGLTTREAVSVGETGHRLLHKVVHRGHPEVEVAHGNHWATAPGGLEVAPPAELIDVLHVPTRDYAQLERRVRQMGEALEHTPEVPAGASLDQRELSRKLEAGELRAWYEARIAPEAIEQGLASGRLVRDTRLAGWAAGERVPPPPDPARAAITHDAMQRSREWADREVDPVRRALRDVQGQLATVQAALDATDAKYLDLQAQLREAADELKAVHRDLRAERSRRVVRYADTANRLLRRE
jgi:hypothetical protein